MRIIAFSDSHGSFRSLHEVVLAQPEADCFLFLGDGMREFEDLCALYPEKTMKGVRGNSDWSGQLALFDVATCAGKEIFFTHGHSYSVKNNLDTLVKQARNLGAHIALFGHTHCSMTGYRDGVCLMNPGSVAQPRDGKAPSYGVIDITPAGIFTHIVSLR